MNTDAQKTLLVCTTDIVRYCLCEEVPTLITTQYPAKQSDFTLPPYTACLSHRVV